MTGGYQLGFSSGGLSGFWRGGEGGGGVKPNMVSVTTQGSAHNVGGEDVVVGGVGSEVLVVGEGVVVVRLDVGVVVGELIISLGY